MTRTTYTIVLALTYLMSDDYYASRVSSIYLAYAQGKLALYHVGPTN